MRQRLVDTALTVYLRDRHRPCFDADLTHPQWLGADLASSGSERSLDPVGYWITSSACASTDCGIVRPSVFAVFRLITSSNLVGCSTGRSPGLAPLRILST